MLRSRKRFSVPPFGARDDTLAVRVLPEQYSCGIRGIMTEHNFLGMRRAMVESQLRTNDVNDPTVIAAILAVPREAFVPEARKDTAYVDRPVPLGGARALNAPLATARLIVAAQVRKGEKVLLIGGATGYAAALLAELGASVVAIESDEHLVAMASSALSGRSGVTVETADLANGFPQGAPYDVILVDGAIEAFPSGLADQLKIGGRAVFGRVDRGVTRLCSGTRSAGGFGAVPFLDAEAVILPGFAAPKSFTF